MIQIDDNTLFIHNGHDNDNEKISDLWKFDISSNQWTEIEQKGEVPPGRNGHSLHLHNGYLIMFGGILEITKESEDIYVFQIETSTWKLIDMSLGPQNLCCSFLSHTPKEERPDPRQLHKLRETQTTPALNQDKQEELETTIKLAGDSLHSGAKTAQNKMKRNANSVPRMGGTSYTSRRFASTKKNDGGLSTKNTFGIIPTLTAEMK